MDSVKPGYPVIYVRKGGKHHSNYGSTNRNTSWALLCEFCGELCEPM